MPIVRSIDRSPQDMTDNELHEARIEADRHFAYVKTLTALEIESIPEDCEWADTVIDVYHRRFGAFEYASDADREFVRRFNSA